MGRGLVALLTEWGLWACANQLVKEHRRGAVGKAGQRILELEAAGDVEGHSTWIMILERIVRLLRDKPAPGEAVQ